MTSITSTNWRDGLTASAAKGTESNLIEANRRHHKGEAEKLASGRCLGIALHTHLKGSRERFAAACEDLLDIGVTTAYEYVQAADAHKVFADAVKATGANLNTIGVRTWAKLDRFTGSDDLKADGLAVVKAEAKRAKVEGTKPFTNAGLADTITALKADGGSEGGKGEDRRVTRIARTYRDDLRSEMLAFSAALQAKGERHAFLKALRLGVAWGAANGAATDIAITQLAIEWSAEEALEAKQAAEVEAKAEAMLAARGEVKVEAPAPKPEAKVTKVAAKPRTKGNVGPITPKAPAPKRGRKVTATK